MVSRPRSLKLFKKYPARAEVIRTTSLWSSGLRFVYDFRMGFSVLRMLGFRNDRTLLFHCSRYFSVRRLLVLSFRSVKATLTVINICPFVLPRQYLTFWRTPAACVSQRPWQQCFFSIFVLLLLSFRFSFFNSLSVDVLIFCYLYSPLSLANRPRGYVPFNAVLLGQVRCCVPFSALFFFLSFFFRCTAIRTRHVFFLFYLGETWRTAP